jgi:RND family efflux transporter MFP subunit
MSRPKSMLRRGIEIGLAAAVLILIFIWSEGLLRRKIGPGDSTDPAEGGHGDVAWRGPVATVERREIEIIRESVGTVRPVREASVSARIMGVVERIAVEEGDRVERGQRLATLSAPELAARSAAAQEAVASARAALDQARSDLARAQQLYEREAATKVELERAETALNVAIAELSRAEEAARGEASVASYATLRAPFDGIVTAKHLEAGDLAVPGAPVVRIEETGRFRLEAPVEEDLGGRVRAGETVQVQIGAETEWFDATVGEIVPAADPRSRTVLVKVDLPAGERLLSGRFGRLRIADGTRTALVVPSGATRRVGGMETLNVIGDDGRIETRYVRTGSGVSGDRVEVLSGVSEGETVAVTP